MPATKQILGCMFTVKRSSVCDVHLFIDSQAKLKCGQLAALHGGAEVCLCPPGPEGHMLESGHLSPSAGFKLFIQQLLRVPTSNTFQFSSHQFL